MSLQMRVSAFHVVFNVTTTCLLLPSVKQLVSFSQLVIREKQETKTVHTLRFVDNHMLAMPPVAMAQVKQEIAYMLRLAEENTRLSLNAVRTGDSGDGEKISENEDIIDFTNSALTSFLIKLSAEQLNGQDKATVGAYFHVLNDLERIGDHAQNFYELSQEMKKKGLTYSQVAQNEIGSMCDTVLAMFAVAKDIFENLNFGRLSELTNYENQVDGMKKSLTDNHFDRLSSNNCSVTHSPYFTSTVTGLERVADHLVNVGYSIQNPTGAQKERR